MSEPYVGEIRMFAGNFAPRSWAFCDGQLLAVSDNDALFALLGTMYGGDGQTTFGLPDLRGRVAIHTGTGTGLSPYPNQGAVGGAEQVTLTAAQLGGHSHTVRGSEASASTTGPGGNVLAEGSRRTLRTPSSPVAMAADAVTSTGGSQPHTNMQPFLAINYIIALYGIFPSRS